MKVDLARLSHVRTVSRLGLLALVATAVASPGNPVLQDELGKHLRATGWKSWSFQKQPDGRFKIVVSAAEGGRVTADWIQEGNKLVASGMTMFVTKDYKLESATMSGGITFTQSQGAQSVRVEAPNANYVAADNSIVVKGSLKLTSTNSEENKSMHATGSGGRMILSQQGKEPLESANIEGPITFQLKGDRLDQGKKLPFHVEGKAGHLTYNSGERKIALTKGVQLSGNDPAVVGDMTGVDEAEILLTENHEIDSIAMTGDPARTVIEQTSKPSGAKKPGTKR